MMRAHPAAARSNKVRAHGALVILCIRNARTALGALDS